MTSTWEDCAVQGKTGINERLYFVNGSGELLVGVRQDNGAIQYKDVIKPGGGSTIPGIDFHEREQGHVSSTSQLVSATSDGGETWEQIGIDFAGNAFFDITSQAENDINVASGSGIIYRYDGFRWTPHVIDDEREAIRAVVRDGNDGLAAGDNGKVYERQSAGQWQRLETSVETAFEGVARGENYHIAVGGNGMIIERQNDSTKDTNNNTNMFLNVDWSWDLISKQISSDTAQTLPSEPLSVEKYVEGTWVDMHNEASFKKSSSPSPSNSRRRKDSITNFQSTDME